MSQLQVQQNDNLPTSDTACSVEVSERAILGFSIVYSSCTTLAMM